MESQDFQHIAMAVRPKLMKLCRSFFDGQVAAYDAEDAVQETLLRLWQMRDRLCDYQKPEALAMLIARNVCIDILKLRKEQHEPLDETANLIGGTQADQSVIAHDTERMIDHALTKLPATQRRMLVMRSEGMSMAEIAAACGATPASAKTMICTARKRMMALLKIASAAAAVIAIIVLLTNKPTDEATEQPQALAVQMDKGQTTNVTQEEIAQPQESVTENPPASAKPEHTVTKRPTAKQPKRAPRQSAPAITERQMNSMMAATNYTNEQVESYRLQPVGDATIVTKTMADGTSASYIVCVSDDNEGLHVVPINIEM